MGSRGSAAREIPIPLAQSPLPFKLFGNILAGVVAVAVGSGCRIDANRRGADPLHRHHRLANNPFGTGLVHYYSWSRNE
jgi:hypothetical protein